MKGFLEGHLRAIYQALATYQTGRALPNRKEHVEIR
jgi:hypothetical protein